MGKRNRLTIDLDPVEPTLLALSDHPLAAPAISGPASAHPGANITLLVRGSAPEAPDVVHVEVIDPQGRIVPHYSQNLLFHGGSTQMLLPLAVNDETGAWQVRVRDALSGASAAAALSVTP